MRVDCLLLDIEGTVCPISFVKDVLFPYALRTLPAILSTKWSDPSFLPYRDAFPEQARRSPAAFEAHVRDLTDRDVKVAYLKNLHGHLWQTGYETAAYSTPLFEDVPAAFARWARQGKEIAIYSSGSVFAQTLLFKHVELGGRSAREEDERAPPPPEAERLCAMISAWFDTTNAGPKTDLGSYQRIAAALGRQPGRILFLSDAAKEVQAALDAGMQSLLVQRPGNALLSDEVRGRYRVIESFDELTSDEK